MKLEPFTEISHGTLLASDLAQALLPYAQQYLASYPHAATLAELQSLVDSDDPDEDEHESETINGVIDALQEFAPPYCVIGMHQGLLNVTGRTKAANSVKPSKSGVLFK